MECSISWFGVNTFIWELEKASKLSEKFYWAVILKNVNRQCLFTNFQDNSASFEQNSVHFNQLVIQTTAFQMCFISGSVVKPIFKYRLTDVAHFGPSKEYFSHGKFSII